MTINKFYDGEATMSGGGEQIPEDFENWISQWLRDNVVSDPADFKIHNAKVTWARAIALDAYRYLSPSRPETGLRWVKGSERTPTDNKKKFIRVYTTVEGWGKMEWDFMSVANYDSDYKRWFGPDLTHSVLARLIELEWLDESAPAEPAKEPVKMAQEVADWEESQEQMDDDSKIFVDKSLAIADRLRQVMEKKGIRQVDLAKLLGKSEPEISKWLAGMQNYTLRTISKLEAALGQSLIVIPQSEPAKESQPDIDIVKLLKWVAKVAPPEFREEKPHTLKGWRFDGKLLSTEQVSRLFFKSAGANSSRPEPPEAPEDKKAHAIEFAKWINNSWYTPHYAKWIHLREGLAGMKTAEELYDIFQMEAAPAPQPEPSEQSQPDAFCQMLIKAREAKGLSITDAENGANIPHGYLAQLEAGKYNQPSAHALYNLAKLYEIELKPLLVAGGLIVKKDVQPKKEGSDLVTKEDILDMHLRSYGRSMSPEIRGRILRAMEEYASRSVIEYVEREQPSVGESLEKISNAQYTAPSVKHDADNANDFYCTKPGDHRCHSQCDLCKKYDNRQSSIKPERECTLTEHAFNLGSTGECTSANTQPSPAVEGEIPDEIKEWIKESASIVAEKWRATGIEDWLEGFEVGSEHTYRKMQEEIEIGLHQINDLREEVKDLQSPLSAKEAEAQEYRALLQEIAAGRYKVSDVLVARARSIVDQFVPQNPGL